MQFPPQVRSWFVRKKSHAKKKPKVQARKPRAKAYAARSRGIQKKESHANTFRYILDELDAGVAQASVYGNILYANSRFAELIGKKPPLNLVGFNLKQLLPPSDWPAFSAALLQGSVGRSEGRITLTDVQAAQRNIRVFFSPIVEGGSPTVRIMAMEDTELMETARALTQSEASVHSLSARLLEVQDEERRRMARDLHDTTGQELAAAVITLDNIGNNLTNPQVNARQMMRNRLS